MKVFNHLWIFAALWSYSFCNYSDSMHQDICQLRRAFYFKQTGANSASLVKTFVSPRYFTIFWWICFLNTHWITENHLMSNPRQGERFVFNLQCLENFKTVPAVYVAQFKYPIWFGSKREKISINAFFIFIIWWFLNFKTNNKSSYKRN